MSCRTASATISIVAGSSRSRRVAMSGSSRWWRTSRPGDAVSRSSKPMRGPITATSSSPRSV